MWRAGTERPLGILTFSPAGVPAESRPQPPDMWVKRACRWFQPQLSSHLQQLSLPDEAWDVVEQRLATSNFQPTESGSKTNWLFHSTAFGGGLLCSNRGWNSLRVPKIYVHVLSTNCTVIWDKLLFTLHLDFHYLQTGDEEHTHLLEWIWECKEIVFFRHLAEYPTQKKDSRR